MTSWDFSVAMDRSSELAFYLQLARAISGDIRRGRLRPGAKLPGSRTMARKVNLHRNTVLAAYDELIAEGWLKTSPTRGTYVSDSFPEIEPSLDPSGAFGEKKASFEAPYQILPAPLVSQRHRTHVSGVLDLGSGQPDLRSISLESLGRAYRRALKAQSRRLLGYCNPEGHPALREGLAEMVSATRGLAATPANVLITRGSQMAWTLLGRALLRPGDAMAVEEFGYRLAWEAFRQSGAELLPIPVDDHGLRVDVLEKISEERRLSALYVTPHHQYPTTVTMAAPRRLHLLNLAARRRFAIIEDDYDNEFHYSGHPVMPLASLDSHGSVIYVSTLSKVLAPGLRTGFVVAPESIIKVLAAHRVLLDIQGDQILEAAIGELIGEGEVQRHINRVKHIYASRRDALVACLRATIGDMLEFTQPSGGLALWAKVATSVDVDSWAQRALSRGVAFHTGGRYSFDESPRPFVRLSFAALEEAQLQQAVRRMASALPDRGPAPGTC